ncbi:MAG: hypothetical protein BAJALOKI1v1_1220002 [Promethearchaeota archaeon]|nr:MAG: hypothetical protein BAJALOKI1v1_1220002 [Candidatus Lokiarchaeota archaeon]
MLLSASLDLIILSLPYTLFFSIECYFFLKSFLKPKRELINAKIDISGVFTRPEAITEEEVSISKEKKIYLVCKGSIGGHNFMCSDCGTFYCLKCSDALKALENAC